MNSFVARKYANKVKTDGGNQSNINSKKLMSYPFPLCSIEEQQQIVHEIDSRLYNVGVTAIRYNSDFTYTVDFVIMFP